MMMMIMTTMKTMTRRRRTTMKLKVSQLLALHRDRGFHKDVMQTKYFADDATDDDDE